MAVLHLALYPHRREQGDPIWQMLFPLTLMSFMGAHPGTYLYISLIGLCHIAIPTTGEVDKHKF